LRVYALVIFKASCYTSGMVIDPISARFAQQNVQDAQARTKVARQQFEDESIRIRESSDKFYGSLALFSGGTIALSITYLGYLKSTPGRIVLYPRVLIAAWICLLVCAVASLFCPLLNSYYAHFARLRIFVSTLMEQKETMVEEMGKLYLVNVTTPEEKEEHKKRLQAEADARSKDQKWAKTRESIYSVLWTGFGWVARLAFPIGLGLLIFFAAKNI
jgi:hypothetical protein